MTTPTGAGPLDPPDFDLDAFIGATRCSPTELALSPDGRRLVAAAAIVNRDHTRFVSALYEIPLDGGGRPRRLTRSEHGESSPSFAADGSLWFVSERVPPEGSGEESEPTTQLLRLPPGGEAEPVACPPGGVTGYALAEAAAVPAVLTGISPRVADWAGDAELAAARSRREVTALLVTDLPARHWDRWLAPRSRRLFVATADAEPHGAGWVDVDPGAGSSLEQSSVAMAPDGTVAVADRVRGDADVTARPVDLVAYEREGGTLRSRAVLADGADHVEPAVSPDGRQVVCVRAERSTPAGPGDRTLALAEVADTDGAWRDLLPGFDRFPGEPVFSRDGRSVLFCADEHGRRPLFAVDLATRAVTRLAADGDYHAPRPAPDGTVYALRSTLGAPPRVVAVDPTEPDQVPAALPTPGDDVEGPGRVERLTATAEDGTEIGAWLIAPPAAGGSDRAAPLAVFIHGGPVSSWTEWSWRWQPHVLAARGWAVLLPDPALSTGYGLDFVARGWGRWGAEPFTDLMAAVETAAARDDVDGDRVAALGGSFGGYMANWAAGHTNRFDAIVTHASLWDLESFHGTTDHGPVWEREFGDPYTEPERYRRWSPRRFVGEITTPMLVIHGTRDYRVPESEGLTLWTDLRRHGVESAYLHFPDEHHWVLAPAHARLWYDTVLAWLDHHVLGEPWRRPDLV